MPYDSSGHSTPTLKSRSVTFTALSLGRGLLILQPRARDRSTSRLWPITTGSWQFGRRIARRISKTAPHWWVRKSPASKAATATPCASMSRRSAQHAPTALCTTRPLPTNWRHSTIWRVVLKRLDTPISATRGTVTGAGGADGKVQQLDWLYPHSAASQWQPPVSLNATIGTPVGQLDAETVARASQALSGEIVLPKLIERLMRIAVEHAGAERGLLILLRGSEPLIEAEATTGHGRVDVHVRQTDITASDLPKSALHYVIPTRERLVLDDASVTNSYSDDDYLKQRKAKSVLCLPIVKQTKLIGVLYLENNLTPHVFTSGRVAVLDMLASQAAISLENARLYAALEQENLERKRAEEELRRSEAYLAEAQKLSCTGSFGWSVATDEHFWSDETYRIFEHDVSSKVSLRMVRERIHPEDIPLFDEVITRAAKGDGFDYEYRLLLPSGAVKQVHLVARAVRGEFGTHELVGAVMDITVTRQAEAALRRAQAELAHVTRVTTMGELAASIAHEVNQPIAGVLLNGNASLRWLARVKEESIALKEARETIQRIIRDGNRAGEILGRIRTLFKKAEPAREPLESQRSHPRDPPSSQERNEQASGWVASGTGRRSAAGPG
jgi:GAF domain-containing protein